MTPREPEGERELERWQLGLVVRKVLPPMGELGNVYSVRRNGTFIGYVARWRRWWLAGRPDGFGTWHVEANNVPILHGRRDGAVLRLAMAAESLLGPNDGPPLRRSTPPRTP